ncbi:hypothetical protein [Clostridium beijerinckii]|uniref:hypothetical protein n=1 Tax=Clostridium beijerinckii TaxID=1520 RepID=UPI0022DFC52B|nr:hypothetical protein [Clostridium beijerinckii]
MRKLMQSYHLLLNEYLLGIKGFYLSAFYPWSAPVLLSPHEGVVRTFIPSTLNMISIVVIFLIGLAISIRKYRYVE